mgnify:CR=1 FL=1
MELRTAASPRDVKHYTTERLREEFLIDDLFQPDVIKLVYSHIDRIITGSAVPVKETLKLTAGDELRAQYFCERRELGVINIGGAGTITIDGKAYHVAHKEGMYIGMGSRDITFASDDAAVPAKFYLNSAPAHRTCPTVLIKPEGTRISTTSPTFFPIKPWAIGVLTEIFPSFRLASESDTNV